jgi:cell division protease FtsH
MPRMPSSMFRRLAAVTRTRANATRALIRRRPRLAAACLFVALVALVALVAAGSQLLLNPSSPATPMVANGAPGFTSRGGWTLADLERHIEAGEVEAITAGPANQANPGGQLLARTRSGQVVSVDLSVGASGAISALTSLGYGNLLTAEAMAVTGAASAPNPIASVLAIVLPLLVVGILITIVLRMSRRSQTAGRDSGSKFMTIMPPDPSAPAPEQTASVDGSLQPVVRIALADVAGCDEAKFELTETIEFLRAPERFRRLGARIPRGIMLYGPPGTGKTMLARAVAAEAGVPFHYASGSEFVEKYVGVGAKRVRDLFAQARKLGRGVIFFDEFDAIGKARGGPNSHEEREQTLNQLLVELDGFGSTDDVIVIAATNRLDILDSAVLRPGRFNRKIHVGMPDVKGRRAILEVHARNKPLAEVVDLDETARKTYGFSGAMLADLLNEAAIMTARRGGEALDSDDIHAGWLKVAVGTSRRRSMDERERSIISAHEIGHAICGKIHGDKRRVEEISLFAHGDALGVTVSSQEDNDLPSESDLRARLIALMGGRAAEEILFHEVTGGASNDFEAANRIATSMVTRWGMGRDPEAAEGGISGRGALSFLVPTSGHTLPSEIQQATTRAIRSILDEAYAEASQTLIAHLETLRRLAAYLVVHERVDGATFDELFDGRMAVPTAGDEWRAATSRPRAWGDIVDLAGHRTRSAARPLVAVTGSEPAAAASALTAPADGTTMSEPGATGGRSRTASQQPLVDAVIDDGGSLAVNADAGDVEPLVGAGAPMLAAGLDADGPDGLLPALPLVMAPPARPSRVLHGRRTTRRRIRLATAGLLRRAERWIRSDALEADRL